MIPLRRPAPTARLYPEQIGLGEIALAWDAARPLRAWGRYRSLSVNTPASVGRGFVHGPAVTFTGNTTAGLLFNGQDAIAYQQFTAMAVAVWNSGGANNYPQLLGTSTLNNGWRLGSAALSGGNIGIVKGASAALSTVALTSGVPFVVVASHDAAGGQYYTHVRRLDTGAIASLSSSNTAPAYQSTSGEFAIGISRTDFSGAWNGAVAMAAMAYEYLPESAALAWLRDPWLLWRAPKSRTWFIPATVGGPAEISPVDSHVPARVGLGALVQTHQIVAAESTVDVHVDTVLLTETENLAVDDSALAVRSDLVTLGQMHVAAVQGSATVVTADAVPLTQTHLIAPVDTEVAVVSDAAALSSVVTVVGADSHVAVTLDAGALTQTHLTAPADSAVTVAVEAGALGQVHQCVPADSAVKVAAEAADISAELTLTVSDSAVRVRSEASALAQTHVVTPAASAVAVRSEPGALTQTHGLTPADSRVPVRSAQVVFLAEVRARVARPQVRVGPDGRRVELVENRRVIHG